MYDVSNGDGCVVDGVGRVSSDEGAASDGVSYGHDETRIAFDFSKRVFDVVTSIAALPIFFGLCLALLVLNPVWNKGSLFFTQPRVGKSGRVFTIFKFRTMETSLRVRKADEAHEVKRVTPLGFLMRRTRIDEVPQFLNVLMGHMSVVGPRPDMIEHADEFSREIPIYRERTRVLPGITGYAQTIQGYTDTIEMAREKARLDAFYVRNRNWRLEFLVIAKTFRVILTGYGAR
ncbi:MAG: sugar transferase [Pseudomonadota bacterium]